MTHKNDTHQTKLFLILHSLAAIVKDNCKQNWMMHTQHNIFYHHLQFKKSYWNYRVEFIYVVYCIEYYRESFPTRVSHSFHISSYMY